MLQSSYIKDLKMFINEESWIKRAILLGSIADNEQYETP